MVRVPSNSEDGACKFVLQPRSVPEQHRLAAQTGPLRVQCRDVGSYGGSSSLQILAWSEVYDVCLQICAASRLGARAVPLGSPDASPARAVQRRREQ